MFQAVWRLGVVGVAWALWASAGTAQDVDSLLARIKAVGKEGAGNVEAARAWKELVAKGPAVMPDVLAGMDDASPVAVNWLRGAVEAIQDKAMQTGQQLPVQKIEAFLAEGVTSRPQVGFGAWVSWAKQKSASLSCWWV